MDIWNSIPIDCYTVPKNEDEFEETMKEVGQAQLFMQETVLKQFWKLALKFGEPN